MAQIDVYKRIAAAMPEDQEVQELCAKFFARAEVSDSRTRANLETVRRAVRSMVSRGTSTVTSKEMAKYLTAYTKSAWSTNKAGYYLRQLASMEGEEVLRLPEEKGRPVTYRLW